MLTIDRQIEAMATIWPHWKLVQTVGRSAQWRGPLRPLLQTYQVEISYRAPLVLERFTLRAIQPRVRVLTPALRPRSGDPEGRLPHVYYGKEDREDVFLCLFDPDSAEWSPADSVAQTTVPWAIDWLSAYEGWRATGHWTATGRHLEQTAI